ncbi:hypothetical protein [Qipengyuania sp. NPDC077563]|uniref:hypothetical protein n=1 Tax=Qipengyuania sp. NPDC077563 TaxID=3364497 RepID=UPI00384FC576
MKDILTRSDRRVAILDIEASALGFRSYPIEVGVALVQGEPKLIETGARIIRPTASWLRSGICGGSPRIVAPNFKSARL